ncbi:unnamed protein product, partial [Meganyctiphanes norvegica]
ISVQQDGQTSNNEIRNIILNVENRLDAKLADLQKKMSSHLEAEISRIIENKLKSHIRSVYELQDRFDFVDEKLELMEKSLRQVSGDLVSHLRNMSQCQDLKEDVSQNTVKAQSLRGNFTKSLENTQSTILNVLGKVDGSWGSWGQWSNCDVSCGGGVRQRRRLCDDPAPAYSGRPCIGSDSEEKHCNTDACHVHVDGSWGNWGSWSYCDVSCGGGLKRRRRLCDDPAPINSGRSCMGSDSEEDNCNAEACPVRGCSESDGFLLSPSGHCFKVLQEEHNWPSAQTRCLRDGLVLAQPEDNDAPWLQLRLQELYGEGATAYWVNGRGVFSAYYWGDGEVVPNDHPLWYPGDEEGWKREPEFTSYDGCMLLSSSPQLIQHHPGRPYCTWYCSESAAHPLCQVEN